MVKFDSKYKINRFVKTKKADYKVPEFLLDKFENAPAPEEFQKKYSITQDEIPLWWTRDVELPLTRKEIKRAKKQALAIQKILQQQQLSLELANQQYKKLLQKQIEQFKQRCQDLDKQTKTKQEQLEILNQHNKIEYENRLMELELELQQINREKEYYQREKQRFSQLEEKKQLVQTKEIEWRETLADIDDEISKQFEENQQLKKELTEQTSHKGLELSAEDRKESQETKVCDITKQDNYEKFDSSNILEIKHVTLTNRDTGYNEFYNISFNVKKAGVTVVYSKSQRFLQGLEMAIMRTLPSNMCLTAGQIRFNGYDIGEVLRNDYRKKIKSFIISLSDTEDKLSLSPQKYAAALRDYEIDSQKLNTALELLELDKKVKNKKLSKIKAEEKEKFAIAALFSINIALKIMYEPQENMSPEKKAVLISLINKNRPDTVQLILTSDKTLAASLDDCSLYSL